MNDKVKEQILAIRDTGLTNMFDVNTVQRIAYEMDFYELVDFIEIDKKGLYEFHFIRKVKWLLLSNLC